jgi:di/tricarboxylate transporter
MPRHDPTPPGYERRLRAWKRYKQLMSWMVILAIVAVLLALVYLKRGDRHVPPGMIIATIAGVGLSVLLGTGLMGLVFVSNSSGIDEEVDRGDEFDERR